MANDYVEIVSKTMTDTVGVTNLIENYKQPFNADFWSAYKALEALAGDKFSSVVAEIVQKKKITDSHLLRCGVSFESLQAAKSDILRTWSINKEKAKQAGIKLHAELEGNPNLDEFFSDSESEIEVVPDHDIICGMNAIYKELPLTYYDEENSFLLKGTADEVIVNKGLLTIADFKTGKEIKKNSHFDKENKQFQMMRYPVMNLKDSNFYHYSLQLSFYAYMILQKNPELKLNKLVIVHYDENMKKKVYTCDYLEKEVKLIIKDYIKKNKIKQINDRNKAFEY